MVNIPAAFVTGPQIDLTPEQTISGMALTREIILNYIFETNTIGVAEKPSFRRGHYHLEASTSFPLTSIEDYLINAKFIIGKILSKLPFDFKRWNQ